MSYTINYNFSEKYEGEDYENLSLNLIMNDSEHLIKSDDFDCFYRNYENEKDEFQELDEHKLSLVDEFRESDFIEGFIPMMNYVHILQREPDEDSIRLINEHCRNCVIISIDEIEVNGIALVSCGMDLSECIELSYFLIDGISPVSARQIMSLSEVASNLLIHCRDVAKKAGFVSLYEIKRFLGEEK